MTADNVTRFARVDFRSDKRVFKDEDRLLHIYIIGKTGTGKSTLLENMALQDLERAKGFALIDPHGDLVGRIAARVPASGRRDVILSGRHRSEPTVRLQSAPPCKGGPDRSRRLGQPMGGYSQPSALFHNDIAVFNETI